ncbi:restriction endonuclease subunit S [Flavobacterium sp. RSB2_4_14]|uniref:restriction endonuclease subunit S n=1 Tax=Flavobacterium sp. RSB2_4_14 TaxID=3447665 RepID=UPI003F34BBED
MPSKWKTYKLSDALEIKYGKDHKKVQDGNIPIYGTGGIMRYGNQALYDKETILIPRKGSLNNIFYLNEPFWSVDTIFWSKINEEVAFPKYLFYNLKVLDFASMDVGSAIPSLTTELLKKIEIELPSIQEQQSITSILSNIDDKIENNLAINKTLEEMAMALYKHWFVDFGPFQDGEFVESELGMIPKGWEVKRLEELVDIGSSKRIFYNEYVEEGIPFYRGKEVIELSKGKSISSELFISNEKFEEIKSKFEVPKKGDILISSVGTIGVSWLVDGFEDFYFKDGNLTWLKKYKTILKGEYFHLWLNSENGKNQIDGEVIGSTQKALTISSLRNFKILFPNQDVYKQIGNEFVNYYELMQSNLIEIKSLTQLRDTLLPKLISGEVRLKEFREN